ncbi:Hsp70 family protein [uncultured Thiodictyon sp.]|uniref:Hsp70 family protein n=1 Tax=uncultured Thiodictyon sp. TaxID=1846217 RepID=UPI0025D44952|nr:Hsp70 family protein [uncultured Thiodictyon sp.]
MTHRATIDFGIDLGTTNSTIAVIDGIDARVIPNSRGSTVTPSAVYINPRGHVQVGQEAKERTLMHDLGNGDIEFKLRMGSAEGKKVFAGSGREMQPEDLSAEVLKSLKTDARSNLQEEVRAAVITVPAAFDRPQIAATQRAAERAGFALAPLLLEPVAASLAYGFQSESESAHWFVYDFGGGTFDAAVMRVRDGLIQVVNHNGDNHLGGKLIDWDLVTELLVPALTQQYHLPDFGRSSPRWLGAIGRLKFEIEKAKIEVCRTRQEVEVYIEKLCDDAHGNPVEVVYTLTPAQVEKVSGRYIQKSLTLCRRTLEEKGLTGASLDRILMVGGSTLNPWVREAVAAELCAPLEFGIDPVTVVARGAAIFASTQAAPPLDPGLVPLGTWQIEIEHAPVGNEPDPDIGGRVNPVGGVSPAGYTIELRDKRSRWSSGRISLGADGVFMTQLFAERQQRCEFEIELLDAAGRRIPTQPESVFYTIGIPPTKPPCPQSIGIALADGSVGILITKGKSLPVRGQQDRRTTVSLRAGNSDDVLRIPVLEGENPRAERNHFVGDLIIRGSDIRRDLPAGNKIEITVKMNESLHVAVSAFVPMLDEEFDVQFDEKTVHKSPEALRKELDQQKARLEAVRSDPGGASPKATQALDRINREGMIAEAEALAEAAAEDDDALSQLDRRLLDLAAAIDTAEDATAWPKALAEVAETKDLLDKIIADFDRDVTPADHERHDTLERDRQRAIASGDEAALKVCIITMDRLRYDILQRLPAFWIAQLDFAEERADSMTDVAQARRLIAQAQRAVNNNDVEGLRSAVRQLFSLLPIVEREEARNRLGSTII